MSPQHLDYLIELLDDPDSQVFENISGEIISGADNFADRLEDAWFDTTNQLKRSRIEYLIKEIRQNKLVSSLENWKAAGQSLLNGYLILHSFLNPHQDNTHWLNKISKIKKDIWLEITDDLTAIDKVELLSRVLRKDLGISGSHVSLADTDTYFLENMIQTHAGNSLSITMLALILAEHMGVNLDVVNIADNFLLALHIDVYEEQGETVREKELAFYLNLLDDNGFYIKEQICKFFNCYKLSLSEEYFKPLSDVDVLRKWCRLLSKLYNHHNCNYKCSALQRCVEVLQ